MQPYDLRCEYQHDPIGIGTARPRFAWRLGDPRPDARQSAWQLLVASTREGLFEEGSADLWDSGRVDGEANLHVEYAGAPLRSRQCAWWCVRSFGGDGQPSPWSDAASFECGLLEQEDWTASWISSPLVGTKAYSPPVPCLRRDIELPAPVAKARLYVTALGLYEISIGGRRVGDHQLAPGWTDYRKRVRYQVHDVTALLGPGAHTIEALLGDGWYCGHVGLRASREGYGERPALLAQLEITHSDGTTTRIVSDGEWSWQASAILSADLFNGEAFDARRSSDAERWQPVEIVDPGDVALDAMAGPPIRVVREIQPVGRPRRLRGAGRGQVFGARFIFDLGQNMVGRVRLRARGTAGKQIKVRHAEALNPDGTLYTDNLKGAAATDAYTFAGGDAAECFEPRFTFHGFRYVEVSGEIEADAIEELTGVVLCSDMDETGRFSCSEPELDQLQHNIVWGQRGNFLDVPTDCPQRDERLGWTGDALVFADTAAFNMQVAGFFEKWLQDLEDAQAESGRVPPVAPLPGDSLMSLMDGGPAWADAIVFCPWTIWRAYGDRRIIEERWDAMVAFVDDAMQRTNEGIRSDPENDSWGGFGDWCALDGTVSSESRLGATPKDLIGTAFLAESARRLAQMGEAVDRSDEAKRYFDLSQSVREAFRRRFVSRDGRVVGNTQTSDLLALHFDLLDPAERGPSAKNLARNVELHGHLTTGFVGTPYLLPVLASTGRLDLAYRLLLRRDYPSWLYPIVHGDATTIWERWNGWTEADGFFDPEMNSFNHYAYGAVGAFLYATVAGLDLHSAADAAGWRRARIAPRPPLDPRLPEQPLLTSAAAQLETQHGRWAVEWQIDRDAFVMELVVPPGCSASIELADGSTREVGAGTHHETRAVATLRDGA